MTAIYLTIWASWFLLAVVAAWGLGWAVRTPQFSHLHQHATMVLEPDDEELPASLVLAHDLRRQAREVRRAQ
jgi:nitrogen fixation-related uncharacterized protein